jgi:transposase InsO family protein
MLRIICLHVVPKKIVSNKGTQFTSKFWKRLHEALYTQLCFSYAYHPQTDGQTERVNQILEDMLRACALQYGRSWYTSLSYVEFSYNNNYQESLNIAHLRCYMVVGAEPYCFGVRLVNGRFSDPAYFKRSRSKFVWLGRTCELHNQGRRVMLIIEEEN